MKKFVISGAVVIAALWSWYLFQESRIPTEQTETIENAEVTETEQAADNWAGWEIATENGSGASFRYPKELGTTYIQTVDWPPRVQLLDEPFSCVSAGDVIARGGQTELRSVEGREYCVTQSSEGAAGSIYVQYAYAFAVNDTVAVFTFTVRMPQCVNYDEPKRTACENEREAFELDPLVDTMARSLVLQ